MNKKKDLDVMYNNIIVILAHLMKMSAHKIERGELYITQSSWIGSIYSCTKNINSIKTPSIWKDEPWTKMTESAWKVSILWASEQALDGQYEADTLPIDERWVILCLAELINLEPKSKGELLEYFEDLDSKEE